LSSISHQLCAFIKTESSREADQPPDFLIITTGSLNVGMFDIHDWRPVVLSPELAREWFVLGLTKERAKKIATDCSQSVDDFEWYPVSKDVGNIEQGLD
jgi:putative SOS response-associated peptidase YedK